MKKTLESKIEEEYNKSVERIKEIVRKYKEELYARLENVKRKVLK